MKSLSILVLSVLAASVAGGAVHVAQAQEPAAVAQSRLMPRATSTWVADPRGDGGHWTDVSGARLNLGSSEIALRISKFGAMDDDVFVAYLDTDGARPGAEYRLDALLRVVEVATSRVVGRATVTRPSASVRRYSFDAKLVGAPAQAGWRIVVPGPNGDRVPDIGLARTGR